MSRRRFWVVGAVTLHPPDTVMNSFRCQSYRFTVLADDVEVGFRTFTPLTSRVAKTGCEIVEQHRRKGYASHSMMAMIAFAWDYGFTTLLTGVRSNNEASIRVLFKNGFRVDYITDEPDGRYYQCRLERHWGGEAADVYWKP